MVAFIKKLRSLVSNRTTYRVGLLQAKAYRILKRRTTELLSHEGLSTIEWALLGLLHDEGSLGSSAIARMLLVEQPFVTVMTAKLIKLGFVERSRDPDDARAKRYALTRAGSAFVEKTEQQLRDGVRGLFSGASARDIAGYIAVLETIVGNAHESEGKPLKLPKHLQ